MFIVDSQVHIWKAQSPQRPWVAHGRERMMSQGHKMEEFTYGECLRLMDEAGVKRVILVPPSWEGDRIDYALEACERHPDRFGIMARIPLDRPQEAKAMLRAWRGVPCIKGIRLSFNHPVDGKWITDGTADWYWSYAEEHDIATMLNAPAWKRQIGDIASAHPRFKIILDHMGILTRTVDDAVRPWIAETIDLRRHANVYVKISALPAYSTQPFPYHNLSGCVRSLIDAFGPRRCFWGTDITRLMSRGLTYKNTVEHFTKYMTLTVQELDWVMGRALCECLNWPVPI